MDRHRRPGDGGEAARTARMIRVDQAGEYGAARIYAGQLAVLEGTRAGGAIAEMAAREHAHLERFDKVMTARGVRPTALSPIWHVAGFALGAVTALGGARMAMACTEAVEEVIEDHYAAQADALGDTDPELTDLIDEAREDEADHRRRAIEEGAREAPCHDAVTGAVRGATRLAIWLSERI